MLFVGGSTVGHDQLANGQGTVVVHRTLQAVGVELVLVAVVGVGKTQVGGVGVCNTRTQTPGKTKAFRSASKSNRMFAMT